LIEYNKKYLKLSSNVEKYSFLKLAPTAENEWKRVPFGFWKRVPLSAVSARNPEGSATYYYYYYYYYYYSNWHLFPRV